MTTPECSCIQWESFNAAQSQDWAWYNAALLNEGCAVHGDKATGLADYGQSAAVPSGTARLIRADAGSTPAPAAPPPPSLPVAERGE